MPPSALVWICEGRLARPRLRLAAFPTNAGSSATIRHHGRASPSGMVEQMFAFSYTVAGAPFREAHQAQGATSLPSPTTVERQLPR